MNFSKEEFEKRYCKPGTPLAQKGSGNDSSDLVAPNFTDWQIRLQADAVEEYIREVSFTMRLS